jgi:molecular chaperone HtpG
MTDQTVEKREFKSELQQVLHLITHSLYSHKEIFLRELLSNASDAIDKIRFNSLANADLLQGDRDWKIKLAIDPAAGTLTVSDNGIGMSREAIIENLGTIARSGTRAFLDSLKAADAAARPDLIGQFGVGFYSAFMVADQVTVLSREAGADQGVRWVSDGLGEFTVEAVAKAGRGTDVILHFKEEEKEFLQPWRLRSIVKQFSDFIEHPIVMDGERPAPGAAPDAEPAAEETLNSRKALWLRSKADVTPEEHNAFYRQIANAFDDPVRVIHYAAEGALEFKALLYIPRTKGMDLQFAEGRVGPKLYINRVQIMDHCEQLLPPYLRFVKGVVDCSDLPLNVSREVIQHSPLLEKIQKSLVKNVLASLEELKTSDFGTYTSVFAELGGILKEGLARDWDHRTQIADLLLFQSLRTDGKFITLAQYVEAMPADQSDIYYLAGEQRSVLEHSPSLEVFRHRGWDVLLLTEPIDEFVFPSLADYRGKPLKAADRSAPELPAEDVKKTEEASGVFQPLLQALKGTLSELKDIRLSRRLKESAACLVADEGDLGANMERLLAKMGRTDAMGPGGPAQRILELNPDHPAVQALQKLYQADPADARIGVYAHLLHDEAVLAEGSKLADPRAFAQRINDLIAKDAASN